MAGFCYCFLSISFCKALIFKSIILFYSLYYDTLYVWCYVYVCHVAIHCIDQEYLFTMVGIHIMQAYALWSIFFWYIMYTCKKSTAQFLLCIHIGYTNTYIMLHVDVYIFLSLSIIMLKMHLCAKRKQKFLCHELEMYFRGTCISSRIIAYIQIRCIFLKQE